MNASKQAVGLLGGSFDPVHNGHISIAESFITSDYISELWVLLTPESPHKRDEPTAVDYDLRLKMLSHAFRDRPNIVISDIEQQLSPPYYTVETLRFLTEKYTDKRFYLCMGSDSLTHFHKWHRWKEILQYCNLLVASRPSQHSNNLAPEIAEQSHYIPHKPVDISSTQIREKIGNGEDITDLVPPSVAEITSKFKLYRD